MSSLSIPISEPLHIFDAQRAARLLSKAIGLDDVSILHAVTAVTDLANHLFIRNERSGKIDLAVVRRHDRLGLEVKAGDAVDAPPVRVVFERC